MISEMSTTRLFLLLIISVSEVDLQVAQSHVRSIGLVKRNHRGQKIVVNIKDLKTHNEDTDSYIADTNSLVSQRCDERISEILAVGDRTSQEFSKQILMCRYQQLRVEMGKNNSKYERILSPEVFLDAKNPYKKEYGDITVNPHNFKFILQPEPCKRDETILITVHSATQNIRHRVALRTTWANPHTMNRYFPRGHHVKLVFVLGLPKSHMNQMLINYEEEMYTDILQVDFLDSYHNNTYKAIYNMKWISSYASCSKAKLVVKTDDDVMFNLRQFGAFWGSFHQKLGSNFDSQAMFIAGNLNQGGPDRNPESKWYLSSEVYHYDTFPIWFQGMVYFLSPQLAGKIYQLSFTTPYIFTDDVYVGIVADRVKDVERYNLAKFYNLADAALDKKKLSWRLEPQVFYHNPSVGDMYNLWGVHCDFLICH